MNNKKIAIIVIITSVILLNVFLSLNTNIFGNCSKTPKEAVENSSLKNDVYQSEFAVIREDVDIIEIKNSVLYLYISENNFLNISFQQKIDGEYKFKSFYSFIGSNAVNEDNSIDTYKNHTVSSDSVITEKNDITIKFDIRYPSEEAVYIDGIKAQTKDYIVTLDGKACPVQLVYAVIEE